MEFRFPEEEGKSALVRPHGAAGSDTIIANATRRRDASRSVRNHLLYRSENFEKTDSDHTTRGRNRLGPNRGTRSSSTEGRALEGQSTNPRGVRRAAVASGPRSSAGSSPAGRGLHQRRLPCLPQHPNRRTREAPYRNSQGPDHHHSLQPREPGGPRGRSSEEQGIQSGGGGGSPDLRVRGRQAVEDRTAEAGR